MENRISIIIPIHNRIDHLEKSLYFINKLDNVDKIEVIISDDNSSDNIESLVVESRSKFIFPIEYTGFHYYDKPHIFRLSKARNAGCDLSKNELFFIMDSDRIIPSNYLVNCIGIYKKYNRECVIGGRTIYSRFYPKDIIDHEFNWLKENEIQSHDRALVAFSPDKIKDITDSEWVTLYGGGIFISKKLFNEIGGFDEKYEGYGHEDNDFALKIRRAGARILLDWNSVMIHMNHDVYHSDYNYAEFHQAYGKEPMNLQKKISDDIEQC